MKLMVLDGNSIVNRAFYAIRTLTTKDGLHTNGIFGFLNILQKLIAEEEPEGICVAFDLKAPTFRHEQFEGYKAKRAGMPDELAMQMPVLKEILDAMNIPRYELEGYEADDIIGTIAEKCKNGGWECIIVTGDRDSLQLIDENVYVKLVKTKGGQTETTKYDINEFVNEYNFTPLRIIDLKALMGDSSDNIPGVPGIGEKTAKSLIERFGGIDAVYSELDNPAIRGSVREKLIAGKSLAEMSFRLATIDRDVPMEFSLEQNLRRPPSNDLLYSIFSRLEFKKQIERFGLTPPEAVKHADFTGVTAWRSLSDDRDICAFLKKCEQHEPVFISFREDLEAIAVICEDEGVLLTPPYAGEEIYRAFLGALFSDLIKKCAHDVKPLMTTLLKTGFSTEGFVFDTALGAYLLNPSGNGYSATECSESLLSLAVPQPTFNEPDAFGLLGEGAEPLKKYAEATKLLYECERPELERISMHDLFYKIELPLCRVLADMEHTGFLVDKSALYEFGRTLSTGLDGLRESIYNHAGVEFNINSSKQLGEVLFDRLMLPSGKKTKTGWSTNIEVLEKLRGLHPIIGELIDYREMAKLKSTYTDGLLKVIGQDGRIHTKFNMTATATGRLSSTDPNLQNIPVRRELGGELRKMFTAGEGCLLVDADYSQIELRLLAHISGDEALIDAFRREEDVHASVAAQVFGVPLENVTSLQRSRAKAVNFGIVYGISDFSLARNIGVSRAEAGQYIDSYFQKYPKVRKYMDNIIKKAKSDGYVTTVSGRRRYLPELKSTNFNVRSFGERVALNMPIQGTAADIIKIAMINVHKRLRAERLNAKLIMQVHDELIVEAPEKEAQLVKRVLVEEMEGAAHLSVPITAAANVGKTWYDVK